MRFLKILLYLSVLTTLTTSCVTRKSPKLSAGSGLRLSLDTSSVFRNSLTGLVLYDPSTGSNLFSRNTATYFVPASNTKLFSLYACLNTLGDSIPALRYTESGDSLFFWGTGDPTLLHPDFSASKTLAFLNSKTDKKLFFSSTNFNNPMYGAGWAWDDYNDEYQPEINALPLFGNIVRVRFKSGAASINPAVFSPAFLRNESSKLSYIRRHLDDNHFEVPGKVLKSAGFKQDIPFRTSDVLTLKLLSDTLHRQVEKSAKAMPHEAKTLYSFPVDTVYRRMMQISDNMLAEQLLLLAGNTYADTINTEASISAVKNNLLSDLPDPVRWADGSGLSRYNLFTPRTMVKLLEKMYVGIPKNRLYSLLAAGGQTGTLKSAYKPGKPFIFAKSGSMSGVYNLSGYLETASGKTLIFSFMNNNFTHPVSKVRNEVARILTWVHENY